jgi:hypothetical protein
VDRVVTDLENPFSGKSRSMQDIAVEKNKQSRILLLGVCRSAKEMLLSLQKSMPNSSIEALWQGKLDAARRDYLAFAEQIGVAKADAEAELTHGLGEALDNTAAETAAQSPDDGPTE